jgi:tyrocidine synthetase-3
MSRNLTDDMIWAAAHYGKERDYWLNKLSGELVRSSFPYDLKYGKGERIMDTLKFDFHRELSARLSERSSRLDRRLYMLLLTGLVILLKKYTGHDDIIVGTPIYRQNREGEYINTVLALRNLVEDDISFKELLLKIVQPTVSEAYQNQNYPVETLIYQLDIMDSRGEFPLFDVALLLENIHEKKYLQHTNPDIVFSFKNSDEHIHCEVEYNTLLYYGATIEQIVRHFTLLLDKVTSNPDIQVHDIEILDDEEKKRLIVYFNDTATSYPREKTIDELYEEQAKRAPEKTAVRYENHSLTYEELNEKSHKLAAYLRFKGVIPEEPIGITADHSVEMIVGLLGVLKAGAVYMPIDPDYPEKRKTFLLKDGSARFLLTDPGDVGIPGKEVIHLNDPLVYENDFIVERRHGSGSLAYIIYTSGSTGQPRGVMVEHRSVVRLVKDTNYVRFREDDRILQTGALEFDASTFEIWGALLNGLELYLADKEKILTPETLKEIIGENRITTIWMTAPLFNRMLDEDEEIFAGLRNLLVGGDVLSPPHINRLRKRYPRLNVINGYGPTENTTFSLTHQVNKEYKESIPIGKPIANSTAYILDQGGYPVPIGVYGDLVVGGDGVSRGYLNNPGLTAEKFVFYRTYRTYISSKKIYKTGDLARWLPDGTVEFSGRRDQQVKIRGYRIEPGEIENRLSGIDYIKEAVVIVRDNELGEKYLCAYIVSSCEIDNVALRNFLAKSLPEYMIPAYFVQLQGIPLTPNGKVDVKRLPLPDAAAGGKYVAPRDDWEEKMIEIWSEILGMEKDLIGIDANFFEVGGHSLKATILISKIHKKFNIKVPLSEIFRNPTVRELTDYMKKLKRDRFESLTVVETKEYYDLSPAQKRLYIIGQMGIPSTNYNVAIPLVLEGDLKPGQLEETFQNLINRHESLRTSFHMKENKPIQKVHDHVEFAIRYYEAAADKGNVETIIGNFVQPFDLSRAPLLKIGLVKVKDNEHILMIDIHHIVTDGTSMQIMAEELMALYREEKLPEIRLQYKDFSEWQNKLLLTGELKKQEEYWLKLYEGDIPQPDLPTDFKRPRVHNFEGGEVTFELDGEETTALNRLARAEGATLYMLLLALYNVFLAKLSDQEDILVGTSTAGRRHADLEPVFGMFVNTLCLRNHPGGERSFDEFLHDVKQRTIEAFENQDYQFEDLVEKLAVERVPGRNPLFNVSFSFHNEMEPTGISEIDTAGLKLKPYNSEAAASNFDLTLRGMEADEKLLFSFRYSTALFEKESVETYTTYFKRIVSSVIENPNQQIGDIKIISDAKEQDMLSQVYDDLENE